MTTALVVIIALSAPLMFGPIRTGIPAALATLGEISTYSLIYSLLKDIHELFPDQYFREVADAFLLLVLFTILITTGCYFIEALYVEGKKEMFYDGRLFYRYGQLVKKDIIPVGGSGLQKDTEAMKRNLYYHLSIKLKERFGSTQESLTEIINVGDSQLPGDNRLFLKVKLITLRGSELNYFVNLHLVGNQIAINSLAYIKSKHRWFHVVHFISTAPVRYWFWIYHWMVRKYSIRSVLGRVDVINTFEKMDLEAYLKSSTFVIMDSIEDFAKENNLYTEQLKSIISNNINNTQNITIRQSKNVRLGRIKIDLKKLKAI